MVCHEENPYAKFFGACNDHKVALDWCFRVGRVFRNGQELASCSGIGQPTEVDFG